MFIWSVKVGFRYVKSRNDKQLWSKKHEDDTKNCAPEATSNGLSIVPCGLIAWSLFNDSYGFSIKNKIVKVSKKNIAWESDKKHKFGSDVYPKNFQNGVLIGGGKLNSSIPVSIPISQFCLYDIISILVFIFPITSCLNFFQNKSCSLLDCM